MQLDKKKNCTGGVGCVKIILYQMIENKRKKEIKGERNKSESAFYSGNMQLSF